MKTVRRAAIIFALLGLWEAVRRFNLVGPLVLASPTEIAAAFVKSWFDYVIALRLTAIEIAIALTFAWGLGIAAGTIAGLRPFLSATTGPLLSSLFAVPLISWYPLFMVWFGLGISSKIAYAIVSGFFPIAINTMNGIGAVEPRYYQLGKAIGCSRRQIIFGIVLPMAMPSIVSGLRIGTALVVIGVIVAEMLGSLGGLGYQIAYYRSIYATAHVYLGILFALGLALVVNWGLSLVERRFTHWREMQIQQ
jgi:NitT/TauT family transport system permease protein